MTNEEIESLARLLKTRVVKNKLLQARTDPVIMLAELLLLTLEDNAHIVDIHRERRVADYNGNLTQNRINLTIIQESYQKFRSAHDSTW